MTINKETQYGEIKITLESIAAVAGDAATECYGVVGMSSRKTLRDEINDLLRKENYYKGIYVRSSKDGYEVDMYIIVAFGLKITEVVAEVQKKVKYILEKTFDIKFRAINVYVQGVKAL